MKKFKDVRDGWCQCGGDPRESTFNCGGTSYGYVYEANSTCSTPIRCPHWHKEKPVSDEDVDRINILETTIKQLEEQIQKIDKITLDVPMLNSTSKELKVQVDILKKEISRLLTGS